MDLLRNTGRFPNLFSKMMFDSPLFNELNSVKVDQPLLLAFPRNRFRFLYHFISCEKGICKGVVGKSISYRKHILQRQNSKFMDKSKRGRPYLTKVELEWASYAQGVAAVVNDNKIRYIG